MKLRRISGAVVVATGALLAVQGQALDSLDADFDGDGIANGADLDADNDGLPDLIEIGAESVAEPQLADGVADDVVPLRQWKVQLYRGHYGVADAPSPDDVDSVNFGVQGTPVLSEEAYLPLDSTTLAYSDNDIPATDNPFDSLQAISRANIVAGGFDPDAASGSWQMVFTRKINAAGVITIGEAGAWFDDFAELFVNGALVDSIIGYYQSLPASEIISHEVSAGDVVEIRLTNRGGPGGFTILGEFPAMDIDADDDGIPNHLDLDSDNDGISDFREHVDATGLAADANRNGVLDGGEFADADADGLVDRFDAAPADPAADRSVQDLAPDTDSDLLQDWRDSDSDGDGLSDAIESSRDSDGDGLEDYRDLDSDNDGIADALEAQLVNAALDNLNGTMSLGNSVVALAQSVECGPNQLASGSNRLAMGLGWNNGPTGSDESVLTVSANGTQFLSVLTPSGGGGNTDNATQNGGDAIITPLNNSGFSNGGSSDQGEHYIDHSPFGAWVFSDLRITLPAAVEHAAIHADLGHDDFGVVDVHVVGGCVNDSDADGIADHLDVDSDGDAIPDAIEGLADGDADNLPDYLDPDSDNDGIADSIEAQPAGRDADGDGIDDRYDVDHTLGADDDGDGVDDAVEQSDTLDSDGDGIPNAEDVDADGDGIPDAIEGAVDSDGDDVQDYLDLDSDDDGIADSIEAQPSGIDSDGDGIDDLYDADSTGGDDLDGDGVSDAIEASGTVDTDADALPDALDTDSDGDSLPDAVEGMVDSDADGVANYLESDSDGDGIGDAVEAGADPARPRDSDADGTPDYRDLDSDGDGLADALEKGTDPLTALDSDGDGTPDYLDLDSDDDGTPDAVEAGGDPGSPVDANGNGIADFRDATIAPMDSDGDGIVDEIEGGDDSDADGVADYLDIDSDNDGLPDADEAGDVSAPIDSDADGVADYLDLDSDNDGLTDALEAGGDDADDDGVIDGFTDADGDGHDDGVAASPLGWPDFDADGNANHLDVDSDNDGLTDLLESGGSGLDIDGDGRIDRVDDSDGDGRVDGVEFNSVSDSDADGALNHLDLDSDNDGNFDLVEAGGDDLDGDGVVDAWADVDRDGVPDSVDVDLTGGEDIDGDGIDDSADADFVAAPDSDGDGIIDMFDDDSSGSGFAPIHADRVLTDNDLPDTDGDGTPDLLQAGKVIRTGLSGGAAFGAGPLLVLLAGVAARVRRRRHKTG